MKTSHREHAAPQRNVEGLGSGSIIEKLRSALRTDGDFPVRARTVNELRALANNPNTSMDQITEVILREPSLGTRVLHLVNSAFYQRSQPIMTVSQAVVQIGMRALSELCAGLVLMQQFVPAAKRGGVFADNLKRGILTSLMTSYLSDDREQEGAIERGYLAGTFFNLGSLLLAYYFPQVYEAAAKRALVRGHRVSQSVYEILGIEPVELSLAIVEALDIPKFYQDVLSQAHLPLADRDPKHVNAGFINALATAGIIAEAIVSTKTREELVEVLMELSAHPAYPYDRLASLVMSINQMFQQHCNLIDMNFLTLPEHVVNFTDAPKEAKRQDVVLDKEASGFIRVTDEIKASLKSGEPASSIVAAVMEALTFNLHYDRVILLQLDNARSSLSGRMSLGKRFDVDPKSIKRPLSGAGPDVAAVQQGAIQLFGKPLFEDGWPFAAIPVGSGERALGVIYADRITPPDGDTPPLDSREQAALTVLADLLDQAVSGGN